MNLVQKLRSVFGTSKSVPLDVPDVRRDARQFRERLPLWADLLAQAPRLPQPARPGILVTPWMGTAVPLVAIEFALALAARGAKPVVIVDVTRVFENYFDPAEAKEIVATVALLPKEIEVIRIEKTWVAPEEVPAFVDRLVQENAIRRMMGETAAAKFVQDNSHLADEMREHAARVMKFLPTLQLDWLLVPGGIWTVGGLYASAAADLGIDFTVFDSGYGQLYLAHNGPASHLADILTVLPKVRAEADEAERQRLVETAFEQMRQRVHGEDQFQLQPKPSDDPASRRCDVLAALNLRWDGAALNRNRLFASVTDWLQQLLHWASKRPGVKVAIRQHPCERYPQFQGSDRFDELVTKAALPNVEFISAHDPVNSYDLLRSAKAFLPFTSRLGLEATMLGRPVVLHARSYYENGGFTWNAESIPHYFELLDQAVAGQLQVSDRAKEDAALAYFLIEKCVFLPTPFTPQPNDFARWIQIPPRELWTGDAADDVLQALLSREALALFRYQRGRAAADADEPRGALP